MKKRATGAEHNDAASDEEQILESRAIRKTMNVTLEYEEMDVDKDAARRREAERFDFGLKN